MEGIGAMSMENVWASIWNMRDRRTNELPIQFPFHVVLSISVIYIFVSWLGPLYMGWKEPLALRKTTTLYYFILMAGNGLFVFYLGSNREYWSKYNFQ